MLKAYNIISEKINKAKVSFVALAYYNMPFYLLTTVEQISLYIVLISLCSLSTYFIWQLIITKLINLHLLNLLLSNKYISAGESYLINEFWNLINSIDMNKNSLDIAKIPFK